MFVDRMLAVHLFYCINSKKTKLQRLELPAAGLIDKALMEAVE